MKTILVIIFSFFSLASQAALLAGNYSKVETNIRTHFIIVGVAEKVGDLFFKSAETKAKLILDLFPNDQVILLTTNAEKDLIRNSIFKTIDTTSNSLKDSYIESIADKVSEIASINIYAHSNALEGAILDKTLITSSTLSEKSSLWAKVKTKIKSNSYVMIHGCNAAVKTAPAISKNLGIAVIGALTSTDFEYVYENKKWAHETEVKTLKRIDDSRVRMKPDNYSYSGVWGDWSEGGFPTYKVFCGNLDMASCGLSAIEAFLTFPSIVNPKTILSKEDFKQNVFDFLCPFSQRKDIFNECVSHLEKSILSVDEILYSPFFGKTLNCSFERCEAHFKCNIIQISINPGSCKLINENNKSSDSFVKEFKFYMDAFDLKTNNGKNRLID